MPELPQSLDRFDILRILGKGGMGTVYLARDKRLEREVALKVLDRDELESEDARTRFRREARAAAAIRHQNVATIYEVGESAEGQPYLAMEYCEGETLSQRIRRAPLTTAEFVSIATQLAAGLAAAHEKGVVHRDIKSANIIIESTGVAKILDFGLAKQLPRGVGPAREASSFASTTGQFFGTLHYLSPEQARGLAADERSDLFAFGVVLYQMATGQFPFDAEAPLLVLDKIRSAEPAPFAAQIAGFPPAAARIISKLLQKQPGDRYQTADDVLRDLEALDAPTLRTMSLGTRRALGRTVPRPTAARAVVAALALAVVVIAGVLVNRQNAAPATAPTAPPPPIRSVAVLPLNNLADSTRDEFLSVGLADALVTRLQQIPSLRIRPTSAILEFQDRNIDARTASERLQVDGVLQGNFLAAGDLIRVNLQLTDTRTGYSVWATSIDGERDDLLELIDDVAARTVTGLNQRLGISASPATQASEPRSSKPAAFEAYVKARSLSGSFVREQFEAQLAALKKAIDIDPNFAAAYADLAIALSLGHTRGLTSEADVLQKAEWYARQAVRLDPKLPQAHLALGRVFVRDPDRYRESAREILASLHLNPSDTHALHSVVTYFVSTGDLQKAECVGNRIVHLDPLSNEAVSRGYWYINAVDPERALANARWALESPQAKVGGHDIRAVALILRGDLAGAEREADTVVQLAPRHYLGKSLHAMIAAARDDRTRAETFLEAFEADARRNHWAAIRTAHVRARLGDRDAAVEWVGRAVDLGHHNWYALVKHPWFEPLQSEPEFQQYVGRIKNDLDDVRDDMVGVYNVICSS